jgi:predicted NUDIX family NTP pyrophosphohydrolase
MKKSAGILLYKKLKTDNYFFIAHPGGPFWKNKDLGSWSIPKGEFNDEERPLDAAIREFEEETGIKLEGDFIELNPVKLKSGKTIYAWALEKDVDEKTIKSNEFAFEWPPKSGKFIDVPEIDKCGWFKASEAIEKLNLAQGDFVRELVAIISNK